jgi:hypothetical protein
MLLKYSSKNTRLHDQDHEFSLAIWAVPSATSFSEICQILLGPNVHGLEYIKVLISSPVP